MLFVATVPLFIWLVRPVLGETVPVASPTIDINRYPPQPQETICGDIVRANQRDNQILFLASDAVKCLTSVPFNDAVALRFLTYLNQTFQFHATTAYQRNPPPQYQQPPTNFFADLQDIQDNVNAGRYHNQYAFEIDVQTALQRIHDSHVTLYGGISSVMPFFSPYNLVSISADGKQVPEIYVYEDLIQQVSGSGFVASPVVQIDGESVIDYLSAFASKQSFGMVEPQADWNQLMRSPAQELFGLSSFSDSAPFYAGDLLKLSFKNGSSISEPWLSVYESPGYTGPLETGGDFYNFFVLGNHPASFSEEADQYYQNRSSGPNISEDNEIPTSKSSWNSVNPAYPADTIMHQEDLGQFTDGELTGYFISDIATAVLSIPSFEQYGDGIHTFSQALTDFTNNATNRNATKIVIDLQQNAGGLTALALQVFSQFFPDTKPSAPSRMRSQPFGDALGGTLTPYFQSLPADPSNETFLDLVGAEWVVTDRLNAERNAEFTSWQEYYGPLHFNGDLFSLTQEYNFSDPLFVKQALGDYFSPCFYNATCEKTTPWMAKDIVILTDGICGSTCSLFVQMMRQAGVQTVAVGGRPETGPMQAASGTRGAIQYSGALLQDDYASASSIDPTVAAALPQTPNDTGMHVVFTGFTLRDQIQLNVTTPNQVLYFPADCRLYWTISNFYDYERLWREVHEAMFVDSSRCVPGSTNVTSPPARQLSAIRRDSATRHSHDFSHSISKQGELMIFGNDIEMRGLPSQQPFQVCNANSPTRSPSQNGFPCRNVTLPCQNRCNDHSCASSKTFAIRARPCYNGKNQNCYRTEWCKEEKNVFGSQQNNIVFKGQVATTGYCVPNWDQGDARTQCSSLTATTLAQKVNGEGPEEDHSWT